VEVFFAQRVEQFPKPTGINLIFYIIQDLIRQHHKKFIASKLLIGHDINGNKN
jgi:hypothetical protein